MLNSFKLKLLLVILLIGSVSPYSIAAELVDPNLAIVASSDLTLTQAQIPSSLTEPELDKLILSLSTDESGLNSELLLNNLEQANPQPELVLE